MNPLVRVCSLLNAEGARYFVIGGQAIILHGIIRTTEDVDILIEPTEENARRVLAALSRLPDREASKLEPRELLENMLVAVYDDVAVDISIHAWKVDYADAMSTALTTEVDGVTIPYLGLDKLIESKSTYRERDHLDLLRLMELKRRAE
jgi:hypothetical protein